MTKWHWVGIAGVAAIMVLTALLSLCVTYVILVGAPPWVVRLGIVATGLLGGRWACEWWREATK